MLPSKSSRRLEKSPKAKQSTSNPRGPVNKINLTSLPMSESKEKQNYTATAEDCLKDLRRLAAEDETKVISRNYYRNNGNYSESVWNRYFGTFHEFKRQAGIVLTRHQHKLERDIAKHAAHDGYRKLNVERAQWGAKYVRENGKRFKLAVGAADFHDTACDPFALRVFIETVKRAQPDIVVLGGDSFDLPEFGKYSVDPREWDVVGRIKHVHENVLRPIREAAPDAQIDLIEGNHEFRILRHLSDQTPALRAVLSDLHGMTVSKLLGLEEFEVNYIAKADLSAYRVVDIKKELMRNYSIYWNSFVVHHFPEGAKLGMPGYCGHHHKFVAWPHTSAVFGAYNFYQLGAMHRRAASYTDGENWSSGIMLSHVDSHKQSTCFEYVDVRDHAVVGGQYYYRGETEI